MSTADTLRAAANKIREVGWAKYLAYDDGRLCALGAIAVVTGCKVSEDGIDEMTDDYRVATCDLDAWLEANGYPLVPDWNDADERSADDVVTGMEKAAAWIEEQA